MPEQAQWGTVNLGVDTLQGHGEQSQPGHIQYDLEHPNARGKQQYNPGRNQELALNPDLFPSVKGERTHPTLPSGRVEPVKGVHDRIKELIADGFSRKEAVAMAKKESKGVNGDIGTITQKEVMAKKYQAEQPWKKVSPFSEQVQGYPFI